MHTCVGPVRGCAGVGRVGGAAGCEVQMLPPFDAAVAPPAPAAGDQDVDDDGGEFLQPCLALWTTLGA